MKLYPFQLKIGKADAPGVSIAGFGKSSQANFLQIFNQMLKSVKELARRMVAPSQVADIPVASQPVKSVATGNMAGVKQANKGGDIFNLQAAAVLPVPLENPGFPANDQANVRQTSEKTINIVDAVENLPESDSGPNAGIQNSTAPPEFDMKQISTRNDLFEAGTIEDNRGHKTSVASAAQRGLAEGNSVENTRLFVNTQILSPTSGNSEVIIQRESGRNPIRNQQVADLSTGPENLSVSAAVGESSDSEPDEKTSVQTAGSTSAAGPAEDYGKLRRIIHRIFSRKPDGNNLIAADESGKADKTGQGQIIKGTVPEVPDKTTVNISTKEQLLSGKAGKIMFAESQTLLSSAKNTVAAKTPEPRFSSSLKQSSAPENDIQSAAISRQATSLSKKGSAPSQNVKSIEQDARFDEIKDNVEHIKDTESHSHNRSDGDFRGFSNSAQDFQRSPTKGERIRPFNGVKEENVAAKAAEQDKGNTGVKNSGGIASAAGKTKEIVPNVLTREKAPAGPEKPQAIDDFPEQLARSVMNRADVENTRMPETIARISLIRKVTQFIEQSTQSGIKRQFSLQLKTDENELVEMRFVRENRQNRGKIWVSSESMAQHLQRNLAAIQDNLLQKGIQFAELTVQLHNSDDFRFGEKNTNPRKTGKKEGRNLHAVEQKPQQTTVKTAYNYGYNTVEYIA